VNSASDGAVITFEAGTYTWTSGSYVELDPAKSVHFDCPTPTCTMNTGANQVFGLTNSLPSSDAKVYKWTGFTFSGGGSDGIPFWMYGTGVMNLAVKGNTFSNYGGDSIVWLLGEQTTDGRFVGVFSGNTFTATNNFMAAKVLGPGTDGYTASPRGTANNLFFEDNTWSFTTAALLSTGCVDFWRGNGIVFRHNSVTNCLVTSHGVVHDGGTVNFELYDNTLTRTTGSGDWTDGQRLFHHQGSGELFAFNNAYTVIGTPSDALLAVTHYRSATQASAGYGNSSCAANLGASLCVRCSGAGTIDGNFSGQSGYPCWFQPGRAANAGSPVYGTLSPMYSWNNTVGGSTKVDMHIEDPWGGGAPTPLDHIQSDRDYYNAVSASAQSSATSPFNGTTGMGFGTLARRPTTCTTGGIGAESGLGGVGYYATDVGTLYRCAATNTWVVHYRPYVYPHPLVSGKPAPPMNPRVQ
jgi:hypothetical protein